MGEDDRALLVKQLVMAKRDNVRYKDDLAQLKDNISNEESEKQKKKYPHLNRQQTGNSEANNDERYKEVIFRLKHLLQVERKSQARLRETYHKSLEGRSELENYLRQCIQDTKKEIARRQRIQSGRPVSESSIKINDFHETDRERVMELLLSRESVIAVLYYGAYAGVKPSTGTGKFTGKFPNIPGAQRSPVLSTNIL